MFVECDAISSKIGELFLNLVELKLNVSTEDVDDTHLIMKSILLSKEQMKEILDSLKISLGEKFKNLTEYSKTQIEGWLVNYVNSNDDIKNTLHQFTVEFKDLQNELFDIKVRQ
jgi:hypothetical protein